MSRIHSPNNKLPTCKKLIRLPNLSFKYPNNIINIIDMLTNNPT